MPKTIQCHECGIVLNLPPQSSGKRLKCPKCGCRFQVDSDTSTYPSTMVSAHDARPSSSQTIPQGQTTASRGQDDLLLPTASTDLREAFDLPLLTDLAAPSSTPSAGTATKAQAGDALALFQEEKKPARRPNAAEARSQARRCPTCSNVVPVGMSICSRCNLDLESGARIDLDDDLMPEAPVRASGPPLPVTVIALIALLGCVLSAAYSTVQWKRGVDGWLYFIPICLFGAFAAVHLLRGHTAKLLIVALSLAAMINVVAFIAMPIYLAAEETQIEQNSLPIDDENTESVAIQPMTDRLDMNRLSLGVVNLILYAGVAVYLSSASVRRHYART
ncbi:hypothetical protein [Singulisphaera sp. PoT]|uniref:hypothetical protein n=1 Tax=Singulisphaera sp. PoT TaxID=3411797 RepID=UPI003BF5F049